jgi:CRISPR system Cascade subunit CasB
MTTTAVAASTEPRPERRRTVRESVRDATNNRILMLQKGYLADRPDAVAALARIRRGAGKPINTVPDLWGLTATDQLYRDLDGCSESDIARAENAVHIAVTLWALHQQSRRDSPMHIPSGPQLGRAVRALMSGEEIDEPLRRRFVRVGTAASLDILAQRLRDLVLVLRQQTQAMDYAVLAEQLYRWQTPTERATVRRDWGRNFHARPQPEPTVAPSADEAKDAS